eukprot:12938329-Prorocentrum_lima.AAC.1
MASIGNVDQHMWPVIQETRARIAAELETWRFPILVTQSDTPLELWDETKEHLSNMANIPVGAQAAPKQAPAAPSSANPS